VRIVLCPRWGGKGSSDWYPWLADRVELPVHVAELDRPDAPTIDGCVASLEAVVVDDLASTLLVGHSVGCQAILRYLASRRDDVRAPIFVAVAGWFSIDAPWDSIRPWLESPLDTARAEQRVARTRVLLSDDDPFTADWQASRDAWAARMGAEVEVHPGRRHFNAPEEPDVARAIAACIADLRLGP
jgi:uncharacterized protein